MIGMVIWAHSICRSVMALYREMGHAAGCPVKIVLWKAPPLDGGSRVKIGFRNDEFTDLDFEVVGEDRRKGRSVVRTHKGWMHLFCVVQASPCFREMLLWAKCEGNRVGVMCEAPCNMADGLQRLLKSLYVNTVLKWEMRQIVESADFFVNYSGDDDVLVQRIGWPKEKIIPFGYFPPPIEGSHFVKRTSNRPFNILVTGVLSRYRGADILVEALSLLKKRDIAYEATITQDGELLSRLRARSEKERLPIRFPGFVQIQELIRLYETCSVYVGAGRSEPWGMRLNDALNCGAPLLVSRGMGGVKLVDDYGCGLSFETGDAEGLARMLQRLSSDGSFYSECADAAENAVKKISPAGKARELMSMLMHG